LAVESERVCSKSPENTAIVLGAAPPFTQAEPFVYNIAEADSPDASACIGNAIASTQQTTLRSSRRGDMQDFRMGRLDYRKVAKGCRSI
jgi:hypothetical protein